MRKLLLIFVILILPSLVVAEVGQGTPANFSSSGTLVASAMETVGYHAQGQIIADLSEDLSSLAGLVYLGVILSIVMTTALSGQYKMALWALVGPPLFIFTSGLEIGKNGDTAGTKNTISASGAEWRFGAFKDPGGYRDELVRQRTPTAEVSFVFHKYNEMISEISQFIINKITSEDISKQMLFMARQRVMEDLFAGEQTEPRLRFLGQFMLTHCSNELSYARLVAQGLRDKAYSQTPDYAHSVKQYCELFRRGDKKLENDSLRKYILSLESMKGQDQSLLEAPVSCLQIWNWFMEGAKLEVSRQLESHFNKNISPEAFATYGAGIADKIKEEIKNKLNIVTQGSTPDPCPMRGGGLQVNGNPAGLSDTLTNLFSAILVRKELSKAPDQTGSERTVGGDYSGITPFEKQNSPKLSSPMANEDQLRRQKAQEFATGRKYEAFNLLMLMPYFQGILLYALAVMYPFFCFLILIPGQAQGFFTWLALWTWVKSWDVGWAAIMLVDQLLWEILPKSTFFNIENTSQTTPATLLETHFGGDYAYSMTSYWLLLSGMISLVPIVTAEAILGSKKSIANFVVGGISDLAGRLSSPSESFVSTMNAMREVRRREGEDGLRNANSILSMQSDIKGMFSKLDAALAPTQGDRTLSSAADHASGLSKMFGLAGGGGEGGGSGEGEGVAAKHMDGQQAAGLAARIDFENAKKVDGAVAESKAAGTPISSNPALISMAKDAIRRNGGIDYAKMGISSPEEIKMFDKYMETMMIERMFAHNLAEKQDVRAATAATFAALNSLGQGDVFGAVRSGVDAVIDARKDSINMVRQTSAMETGFIGMLDAQMRWERVTSPEFIESESIRAYLTQNRNEWFFNPDPLTSIYQDVTQDIMKADSAMNFHATESDAKDQRSFWDQIYQHFSPVKL